MRREQKHFSTALPGNPQVMSLPPVPPSLLLRTLVHDQRTGAVRSTAANFPNQKKRKNCLDIGGKLKRAVNGYISGSDDRT
jgi:hypothetical protein